MIKFGKTSFNLEGFKDMKKSDFMKRYSGKIKDLPGAWSKIQSNLKGTKKAVKVKKEEVSD